MDTGIFQKKIDIGGVTTRNNVFMAPLAGYTDAPFRAMVVGLGAGLTVTEMVSCKGLCYGSEKTEELLSVAPGETPSCAQIFGNDPEIMLRAVLLPALQKFDIIDVNMGCPVPKLYKNGEGSALLNQPMLAEKIVQTLSKSGKPITVKMRIGVTENAYVTREFAKRMEGAGAKMITVHGRVREAYYAGEPNYAEIASAVSAVQIPVIANGGIFTVEQGKKMMEETGAAGIMLARGGMMDPRLFCDFSGVPRPAFLPLITKQINDLFAVYPEGFAAAYFRKQFSAYLHGVRGAKRIRERLFRAVTKQELLSLAEEVDFEDKTASIQTALNF